MWHPIWIQRNAFLLAVVVGAALPLAGRAAPAPLAEPSTYLCDAPDSPVSALAGEWLSRMNGWSRLEEDDKTHAFRGQPVFMNDKIVAVLEGDSPVLAVYSRQTQGSKLCARLQPICDGRSDMKRTSVVIKENGRSAVAIEVSFGSPRNQTHQFPYELNAGEPFVKTTASSGVEKLRVQAPCRFAVLPDFFADDIVVDATTIPVSQAELPSENFLLHMMHGGEAILMTVSESRDNDILVHLSGDSSRQIAFSDVVFGNKPRI